MQHTCHYDAYVPTVQGFVGCVMSTAGGQLLDLHEISSPCYIISHVYCLQGKGVSNAAVYLNGKQTATSDTDGSYTLYSITAGTYTLGVTASRLVFDDVKVTISSTKPHLPDLMASRYHLTSILSLFFHFSPFCHFLLFSHLTDHT